MSHAHAHASDVAAHPPLVRRMALAVGATLFFVVGEAAVGIFSHSLALLSDAGHNFADGLALLLCWYGLWIARRPSDARRTYGSHRVEILAALANASSLLVIALAIVWAAVLRLNSPVAVDGVPMIVVACLAVTLNGAITFSLHHGAKTDLNVRGAYLHMLGDALSAIGVVVAGILIHLSGSSLADPIVSFLIAALILGSSWRVLVEAVNVLLEAAPKGLDMAEVARAIHGVEGVLDVHDLHVWTLASGIIAASCHILITEQSVRSGQQVLAKVVDRLQAQFAISHTTVQIEVEGCGPNDMYCTMRRLDPPHEH